MALIKTFGNPKNDPGTWFEYGKDPDQPQRLVRFRLRRVRDDEDKKIAERYGEVRVTQITVQESTASVKARLMTNDEMLELVKDRAVKAWVDSENLYLTPGDEESASTLSKYLDSDVKVGEETKIDGRLSDKVKRHILDEYSDLATWINSKVKEMERDVTKKEAGAAKN